jgi:hypothetical protein
MRFILVANNLNIDHEISQLNENENDNLILFNFLQPFHKYEKLRNFKNITVMSRKRSSRTSPLSSVYAGLEEIKANYDKFKTIIFHKPPESYGGELRQACIDSLREFNFLNSPKTTYINADHYKRIIGFRSNKALSSGLIAYTYYKLNKSPDDEIVIIGFTSSIATRFHEVDWERDYFKQELIRGNCRLIS